MEKYIYIATKPLQVVNALNIDHPLHAYRILFVVDSFFDSASLVYRLKEQSLFDEVHHVKDIDMAYRACVSYSIEACKYFIPSDYGLHLHYWLWRLRRKEIWIYEEGLGNYDPDFSDKYRLIRLLHVLISGCYDVDMYYGANPYVRGVILYQPHVFKYKHPSFCKEVRAFNKSFLNHIGSDSIQDLFSFSFDIEINGKNCLLYLTTWTINDKVSSYLNDYDDYVKICKLHPHIKENGLDRQLADFDYIISNSVLAEIVISMLVSKTKHLIILHENSTSVLPFVDNEQIELIDISQ